MALKHNIPGGIGAVWNDGLVKFPFHACTEQVFEGNWKRLIYANQAIMFAAIEAQEGILFDRDSSENPNEYFANSSIHYGLLNLDSNRLAVHIDCTRKPKAQTNSRVDELTSKIYVTLGRGKEIQKRRAGAYLEGILGMAWAMDDQELVKGWPANIATEAARKEFQPTVIRETLYVADPDEAEGSLAQRLGPLPTLILKYKVQYRANTRPIA